MVTRAATRPRGDSGVVVVHPRSGPSTYRVTAAWRQRSLPTSVAWRVLRVGFCGPGIWRVSTQPSLDTPSSYGSLPFTVFQKNESWVRSSGSTTLAFTLWSFGLTGQTSRQWTKGEVAGESETGFLTKARIGTRTTILFMTFPFLFTWPNNKGICSHGTFYYY